MTASEVGARAEQARQFLHAADIFLDEARAANSVSGSNAVLAGIAAADAICGKLLGLCSKGEDHRQAISLLERALGTGGVERDLGRLLSEKSLVSYSAQTLSDSKARDLVKYARRLVDRMDQVLLT